MMVRVAAVHDQGQVDGDSLAVRAVGTACRKHRDEHETPHQRETGPIVLNAHCAPLKAYTSPCYGSLIVKLTVEEPPKAAPETTAGGVTGVMGNGQSGSM